MPICIAGMHRSGTSMVARLLKDCGLSLGRADELLPAQPDNPEGFWENRQFVHLNNIVLEMLSGNWAEPPAWPEDWRYLLRHVLASGRDLLCEQGPEPWGWKDPRNSLTLPFWRELIPNLRIVICVRHPLEVAHSLFDRDRMPFSTALRLWRAYYEPLLKLPAEICVWTRYADYFRDGPAELRRVTSALGLASDDDSIMAACRSIRPDLRHTQMAAEVLPEFEDLPKLYASICGSIPSQPVAAHRYRAVLSHAIAQEDHTLALAQELSRQADQLTDKTLTIRRLEVELAQARAAIADMTSRLAWRRYQIADRVARLVGRLRLPRQSVLSSPN